jgi:hypothetical protein
MDKTLLTSTLPAAREIPKTTPAEIRKKTLLEKMLKPLLVLATLLVCLATLELGLRITGRYKMGTVDGFLASGAVSYVLKANAAKTMQWPTLSFNVYTSDLGFRTTRPGPHNLGEKPYYAVLGSSEVFGNGLDYEDTFVGVFARRMASNGVDTVNLAVPGHHLLEQVAVFNQFTQAAKPAPKVVIIFLNPLFMGGYDDTHRNTIVRRGELFDSDNWRMALARMVLANSSASYCFFRDGLRSIQGRYFTRQDFALSFYIERYSTQHRIRNPEKTQDFLRHLKELEDNIRSLNATPVCVYAPAVGGFLLNDLKARGKLDGSLFETAFFTNLAREHSAAEGIRFINLEPLLQERYDRGEKLNFEGDAHFNGPTSRAIGEYLYAQLKPADTNTFSTAANQSR